MGNLTKEWIRMILNGEKKLLPKVDVQWVDVGHYPEVSVKALYAEFAQREDIKVYLPPKINKGR